MSRNHNYNLQNNESISLVSESNRKEFLDRCEKAVLKIFEKRQAEEAAAYNKHKDFVIRWP